MRCFAHRDAEAIAICKHCARALCAACAVVGSVAVSCAGPCEEQVVALQRLNDRSRNSLRLLGKTFMVMSFVVGFTAIVFSSIVGRKIALEGLRSAAPIEGGIFCGILWVMAIGLSYLGHAHTRGAK